MMDTVSKSALSHFLFYFHLKMNCTRGLNLGFLFKISTFIIAVSFYANAYWDIYYYTFRISFHKQGFLYHSIPHGALHVYQTTGNGLNMMVCLNSFSHITNHTLVAFMRIFKTDISYINLELRISHWVLF